MSPFTRASEPRSRAGHYAGAAVQDARGAKGRTYPELLQTRRCKRSVLAIEVGGRWSQETTTFLRLFAQTKARTVPARFKASFTNVLIHHWSAQITHAAMTAYAATLLEFDCVASTVTDGNQPVTSEVLAEAALPPAGACVARTQADQTGVCSAPITKNIHDLGYTATFGPRVLLGLFHRFRHRTLQLKWAAHGCTMLPSCSRRGNNSQRGEWLHVEVRNSHFVSAYRCPKLQMDEQNVGTRTSLHTVPPVERHNDSQQVTRPFNLMTINCVM